MPTQPYYFDLLKKYVLVKAGISTLSPGDCKLIALDIKKATGNIVSETTLKRFFGFANKKYNLSKFTINTLSEYVGYHGWDAFQQAVDVSGDGEIFIQSTNWKQLRQRAEVITHITLKTIQNHSGIPWNLTIPRQFVEKDFSYFIDSAYKFTTFISAPSSGRSLLLAHLVENFFVDPAAPHHNSIVWFVNAGILNSLGAYGFHLDDWFNEQLGLVGETTFREYFLQHPEEVNGKIFLILDGFDEYMFTDEQLTKLFNNITDLVCYNDEIHWLKVVVSMRTSTWQRMEEKLMDSEYLRKQWYPGVFFRKEHHTNMPPLNNEEIKNILSNIEGKPVDILKTPAAVLQQFRHPFYLQLYYQIKEKEKDFHHALPYTWHELVAECVMKKLYLTRRSTEKIVLLNRFIALTDNGNGGNKIEKKKLLAEINQYPDAYEELISSGVWSEENHSRDMTHRELILFADENVFQYFIARKLIEQFGQESFPDLLLKEIRSLIADNDVKKTLIQWMVRYAIKENKLEALGKIFRSGLFSQEKNQLALFACALLNKEKYIIPEDTRSLPSGISSFTEEFLDFELVNPAYEQALRTLADFSGTGINKINIYCILTASALMEINKDKTIAYLRILKHEDESLCRKTYPIHPVRSLRFIAGFFMGHPQQEEVLEEIGCFIKSPPARFKKRPLDCSLSISYHLAIIAWSLAKDASAVINLIYAIRETHPSIFIHRGTSLSTFLLNRLGVAFTITGQFKEAERLNDHLKKRTGFRGNDSLTNGTSMLAGLLDAVLLEHHGKTATARDMRIMAYNIAAKHFPLMQAYIGSILVENYKRQDDFEKATSALKEMTEVMQKDGFVLDKLLRRRLIEAV